MKKDNPTVGWGIASFVLGLLGLLFFWVPLLGLLMAILAIIFYVKQKRIYPTGLATAGLVLGIIALVILAISLAFSIILMWGQSFTKQIQEDTAKQTDMQLTCATDVIYDIANACYIGDSKIKITLKNDANKQIEKFKVRVFRTASDATTTNIDSPLVGFSTRTDEVSVNQASKIKKVELIPIINIDGKLFTCSANIDSFGDIYGNGLLACS